jgi:CBS domain-containing protein
MKETASDLMQTAVKVIDPEESLIELERALLEARVSGFPVVDKTGRLVGIVSRSDLVRQLGVEQSLAEYRSDYYRDLHYYETDPAATLAGIGRQLGERIEQLRVKDVMIRNLRHVSPDTPVQDIARMFIHHHIHRLPVVAGDRLVGIVTTIDLIRLIAEQRPETGR